MCLKLNHKSIVTFKHSCCFNKTGTKDVTVNEQIGMISILGKQKAGYVYRS